MPMYLSIYLSIYLSKLSTSEILFLLKCLKFIPTSNTTDKGKLKIGLEAFGRMLQLMWFLRNDEKEFYPDKFKPKFTFNQRNRINKTETKVK